MPAIHDSRLKAAAGFGAVFDGVAVEPIDPAEVLHGEGVAAESGNPGLAVVHFQDKPGLDLAVAGLDEPSLRPRGDHAAIEQSRFKGPGGVARRGMTRSEGGGVRSGLRGCGGQWVGNEKAAQSGRTPDAAAEQPCAMA